MVIPVPDLQNKPPEEEPAVEILINISAAAYSGCPSDSTVSLLLHFPQTTTIALADTGSTNTFMDYQFSLKHKIPLSRTRHRSIKVASGGILSYEFMAYNCPFSVQGHKFSVDFRILELQGSDLILGVNWFTTYNPVTFDFIGTSLTIVINGSLHTFHDHIFPRDKFLISSDQCSKLIEQGSLGYMVFSSC
jgi:hypothetical protein